MYVSVYDIFFAGVSVEEKTTRGICVIINAWGSAFSSP